MKKWQHDRTLKDYNLRNAWKIVIALTSPKMLGPTMIHAFAMRAICIHLWNPEKYKEACTKIQPIQS
jgi:hypothetical protein